MTIDPVQYARRWKTLAVLSLSLVIIGLDNTILNVALPTLQEEFDASASKLQWMVFGCFFVAALLHELRAPSGGSARLDYAASSADRIFSTALCSAASPPPAARPTDSATSSTSARYASTSSGAFCRSVAVDACNASSVPRSTSSGDALRPNPLLRVSPSSRTSSLVLFLRASARCFASAPASLKVSKKLRSLSATSIPAPVTPLCNVSHSCSLTLVLSATRSASFVRRCRDAGLSRVELSEPLAWRDGARGRCRASEAQRRQLSASGRCRERTAA